MTLGQASHNSVRRIGPSTSAFLANGAGGGSGRSSSSTGISGTAMSGNLVCLRAHDPPKREQFGDKIMRYLILGARSDAKPHSTFADRTPARSRCRAVVDRKSVV